MAEKLQSTESIARTALVSIDVVLEKSPSLCSPLNENACIVRDPHFELDLLKLQRGHKTMLTPTQRQELSGTLLRIIARKTVDGEEAVSFIVFRAVKRLPACDSTRLSALFDLQFLLPMSNMYKLFFSLLGIKWQTAKKVCFLQTLRGSYFFFMNRECWDIEDVKLFVKEWLSKRRYGCTLLK